MHDRAARPTGAIRSMAAMAIETMILLNIDFRIPRVRPHVEEKRSVPSALLVFLLCSGLASTTCFKSLFATGLSSIVKPFEIVTNMLVVIIESSENHL